jgi:ERCC4-type nuclease
LLQADRFLRFFLSLADLGAGAGLTEDEREEQNLSLTPHDILRKLPGVNLTNIRVLLQHVNNLRELCEASLADLTKWMAGAPLAKKLYNFLHEEP